MSTSPESAAGAAPPAVPIDLTLSGDESAAPAILPRAVYPSNLCPLLPGPLDIDFFSVRIGIDDIVVFNNFFQLASSRIGGLKDTRVTHWLQITAGPVAVFAQTTQREVAAKLREKGAVVDCNANPDLLSRIVTTPYHSSTLIAALRALGIAEVVVYSYGFKAPLAKVMQQVARVVIPDPLNKFDIGRMYGGEHILTFDLREGVSGGKYYPAFGFLSGGFGGLDWTVIDGVRLSLYQRTTHVWKCVANLDDIPKTYHKVHTFEETFRRLIQNYKLHRDRIGGCRLEAHVTCRTFEEAAELATPLLDLTLLFSRGLLMNTFHVDTLLGSLDYAFQFASDLRLFTGANAKKVKAPELRMLADLMRLAGYGYYWLGKFTSTILDPQLMYDHWRSSRSADHDGEFQRFNVDDMYLRLKVARAKRGSAWTLSKRGSGAWGRTFGYGLRIENFYDQCEILRLIAEGIVKGCLTTWKRMFVLENSIRPERRRVLRFLTLRGRGFTATPDSLDELDALMSEFEERMVTEVTHVDDDDANSLAVSPSSARSSLADVSEVSMAEDTADIRAPPARGRAVGTYRRRRADGFTPEQDELIRLRVAIFGGGRVNWRDVYDPQLFGNFTVQRVRERYRWLVGR